MTKPKIEEIEVTLGFRKFPKMVEEGDETFMIFVARMKNPPEFIRGEFSILITADPGQVKQGNDYRAWGRWDTNSDNARKWGAQFRADHLRPAIPFTRNGVVNYLREMGRGLGMGPATAAKIWDEFGPKAVEMLRTKPDTAAAAVNGLRTDVAHAVADELKKREAVEACWIELKELLDKRGFPKTTINKAVRLWGPEAIVMVQRDPYKLMQFRGCGFVTCDKMYLDLGHNPKKLKRQAYCAWHAVASDRSGSVWVRYDIVRSHLESTISREINPDRGIELALRGKLLYMVERDGHRWLAEYDESRKETKLAEMIVNSWSESCNWPEIPFSEEDDGLPTPHQYGAARRASVSPVSGFVGGPGTGKSHTIAYLIRKLVKEIGPDEIAACAPTGKAATRMNSFFTKMKIPLRAVTIHSLLGVRNRSVLQGDSTDTNNETMEGWQFLHGPANPLPFRYVIIDECFPQGTLVDTPLGRKAIETIKPGEQIVNAIGEDVVVATKKRRVDLVAKIHVGNQEVICSASHPFFTRRGFVVASELRSGDTLIETTEAMRLLRNRDHSEREPSQVEAFLQHELLNEMVDAVPGVSRTRVHGRTGQARWGWQEAISQLGIARSSAANRSHSQAKTNEFARCLSEDIGVPQGKWASPESSRRKRSGTYSTPIDTACGSPGKRLHRVGCGIRCVNQRLSRIAKRNQARYCPPESNDLYRSRRGISLLKSCQRAGLQEGIISSGKRVDCVEVLESGDPRMDRFREADGKLYFYDLQAARHPTFSVNGFLVHNCSMIDLSLAYSLFAARGKGTQFLLTGDIEQLPPVGSGAPMRDFMEAGLPCGRITEIHRNAGGIVQACTNLREGKPIPIVSKPDLDATPPVNNIIISCRPDDVLDRIVRLLEQIKASRRFDPIWDVQVVCAVNEKSPLSRAALNDRLRLLLNPGGRNHKTIPFRVGDKVIQMKNEWLKASLEHHGHDGNDKDGLQLFVANGDFGRVIDFDGNRTVVEFDFPRRVCIVPGTGNLQLAYACTVHKMQGSSAPVVIVPIDNYAGATGRHGVVDKAWFNTAWSRAEQCCFTIGDWPRAQQCFRRSFISNRKTFLAESIREIAEAKGIGIPSYDPLSQDGMFDFGDEPTTPEAIESLI